MASTSTFRYISKFLFVFKEINQGVPGRILVYASISGNSLGKRQLCMTLIKELIRNRWSELLSQDRQEILLNLLTLAVDSNTSIRKLAHASIGMAARGTGFCNWSDLVVSITNVLSDPASLADHKLAMLDLLQVVIEEAGGSAISAYIESILTVLLTVSFPRQTLSVFTSLMANLARDEEFEIIDKLNVIQWSSVIFSLDDDFKNLRLVVTSLKKLIESGLGNKFQSWTLPVIEASITCLERNQSVYESLVVTSEEGGIDEDDENGLSGLVIAICDLLSVLALDDDTCIALSGRLTRIFIALAPYLQITVSNEQEWENDIGMYISSEDDDFVAAVSIRLASESLVADLMDNPILGTELGAAISEAGWQLIKTGLEARENENCEFWRFIEAGLFIPMFKPSGEIISLCLNLCHEGPPLLRGRAFAVLGKTSGNFQILKHATEAMISGPIFVQFAASRVFSLYVIEDLEILKIGLSRFVQFSKSETLYYFGLECLLATTRKSKNSLQVLGNEYNTFLLETLVKHIADPLVSNIVIELVQVVFLHNSYQLISVFAPQMHKWFMGKDFQVDIALEFIELFAENDPHNPALVECIRILPSLSSIGENTALIVDRILALTC